MSRHIFVVGAQRSGTTYLYKMLDEHPQIEMNKPVVPEPKFFLAEDSDQRVDDYIATFFSSRNDAIIRGDKSASYMESPGAARRIASCFPDALILFTLRDPIDRAISNFWYSTLHKFETKSIDVVLAAEAEQDRPYDPKSVSVSPYAYLRRGRYYEYADMWAQHFDKQQMKIVAFEKFVGNSDAIKNLYRFLGVDPDFTPPSLKEVVNEGPDFGSNLISKKTEQFLRNYFREPNRILSERYQVDNQHWRS